jgi:hypothetical protein
VCLTSSLVRLLLNIEQLLSEEVSVFEEVILVKMPEMIAMVPNPASSLERSLQHREPYSYDNEAIKAVHIIIVHIIIIHICLHAIDALAPVMGKSVFEQCLKDDQELISSVSSRVSHKHERGQMGYSKIMMWNECYHLYTWSSSDGFRLSEKEM